MSYRINYRHNRRNRRILLRLPVLWAACFAVFLLLVKVLWPEGSEALGKLISGSGGAVAVSALNEFAEGLYLGEGVMDSVAAFCGKLFP